MFLAFSETSANVNGIELVLLFWKVSGKCTCVSGTCLEFIEVVKANLNKLTLICLPFVQVHKKDKKYKCMVCKKIFMLAASVGIRHGSRRYGVCVDCADKSQPGGQEGVDQVQDADFPRDEEFEENEVGEAEEELPDDVEEQTDQTRWDESGEVCVPLED